MTLTVVDWIDIFTKLSYYELLSISLKYCQKHQGLLPFEYVFMTNHIHLIASARRGYLLSQIIGSFKKHTMREIRNRIMEDNSVIEIQDPYECAGEFI